MHYLQTKDYVQCPSDMTRHSASSFRHYNWIAHLPNLSLCNGYYKETVICSRGRSCCQEEEDGGVGSYQNLYILANNPAFDPKRLPLHRLFFINENRTKFVSVGFYPVRDYLPLVGFGVLRMGGGPKNLDLSDEQLDALAETLPTLREVMCIGEAGGRRCESGAFRLDVTLVGQRPVYTSIHSSFL